MVIGFLFFYWYYRPLQILHFLLQNALQDEGERGYTNTLQGKSDLKYAFFFVFMPFIIYNTVKEISSFGLGYKTHLAVLLNFLAVKTGFFRKNFLWVLPHAKIPGLCCFSCRSCARPWAIKQVAVIGTNHYTFSFIALPYAMAFSFARGIRGFSSG